MIRHALPVLVLAMTVVGCNAFAAWAAAPADAPIEYQDPNTGATVAVELPPPGDPLAPVVKELPGGGTVTIDPGAGAQPPETRGEVVAGSVGPIVNALTGNPFLAWVIGGMAAGAARKLRRKPNVA